MRSGETILPSSELRPIRDGLTGIHTLTLDKNKVVFDRVNQSILSFGRFSEEQLAEVKNRLHVFNLKKGMPLIREGQTCQYFYFVSKGAFCQFQRLEDGQEVILNLFVENDWAVENKSLITQQPSATIIVAMETSEVFALSIFDIHELIKISDAFFMMGKLFDSGSLNPDFQSSRLAPEEKYRLLLASRPLLMQKFSLKVIASYLGMTPETLSRVRRKIIS